MSSSSYAIRVSLHPEDGEDAHCNIVLEANPNETNATLRPTRTALWVQISAKLRGPIPHVGACDTDVEDFLHTHKRPTFASEPASEQPRATARRWRACCRGSLAGQPGIVVEYSCQGRISQQACRRGAAGRLRAAPSEGHGKHALTSFAAGTGASKGPGPCVADAIAAAVMAGALTGSLLAYPIREIGT